MTNVINPMAMMMDMGKPRFTLVRGAHTTIGAISFIITPHVRTGKIPFGKPAPNAASLVAGEHRARDGQSNENTVNMNIVDNNFSDNKCITSTDNFKDMEPSDDADHELLQDLLIKELEGSDEVKSIGPSQ